MGGQFYWKSPQINPQSPKKSPKMAPKSPQIEPWGLQNVVKKLNLFFYRFRGPPMLFFLPFLGPFWDPKTAQIGEKTRKIRCPKITWFFHRFFTVFEGVRTPEIVLPSRRNTNFRKIDFFRKSAKNHNFWDPKISDFLIFSHFLSSKFRRLFSNSKKSDFGKKYCDFGPVWRSVRTR